MLEVAQQVQVFLHRHDRPHVSLHEEMLQRQQRLAEEEERRREAEKDQRRRREEEEVRSPVLFVCWGDSWGAGW